jgi:hypothetical protein
MIPDTGEKEGEGQHARGVKSFQYLLVTLEIGLCLWLGSELLVVEETAVTN